MAKLVHSMSMEKFKENKEKFAKLNFLGQTTWENCTFLNFSYLKIFRGISLILHDCKNTSDDGRDKDFSMFTTVIVSLPWLHACTHVNRQIIRRKKSSCT